MVFSQILIWLTHFIIQFQLTHHLSEKSSLPTSYKIALMNHPTSHYPVLFSLLPLLIISGSIYANSMTVGTLPVLLFLYRLMDSYFMPHIIICNYHLFCGSNHPQIWLESSMLPCILLSCPTFLFCFVF